MEQTTQVDVQPFGGITWEDSFPTVVAKINGQGVTKSSVILNSKYTVDVSGLTDPAAIETALKALLAKAAADSAPRPNMFEMVFKPFKDPDGAPAFHWFGAVNLEAEPITLAGAPFKVKARFESFPGLLDKRPQNAFWVEGATRVASVMALTTVTLGAMAATKTQLDAVVEALRKKYGPEPGRPNWTGARATVAFASGGSGAVVYDLTSDTRKELEDADKQLLSRIALRGQKDQADLL